MKDQSVPDNNTIATSVLLRAQGGDQDAFDKIAALYTPLVHHWCRKRLSQDDVLDVGQDVFFTVSRSLGGFRREKPGDSFRGWLFRITQSRLSDFLRKGRKSDVAIVDPSLLEQVAMPDDEDERNFETETLYKKSLDFVRGEFPERQCQAFHELMILGKSAAEIAPKLGVAHATVFVWKSRILKRLRDEFSDIIDFDNSDDSESDVPGFDSDN